MDGTWAAKFLSATTYSKGLPADTFQQLDNGDPCFQSPKVYRFKTPLAVKHIGSHQLSVRVRLWFLCESFHTQAYGEARYASTFFFRNRTREEEPVLP